LLKCIIFMILYKYDIYICKVYPISADSTNLLTNRLTGGPFNPNYSNGKLDFCTCFHSDKPKNLRGVNLNKKYEVFLGIFFY